MDERNVPVHQDELSEEDLEVLRAFHSNEEPPAGNSLSQEPALEASFASQAETAQSSTLISDDEMLAFFATEADEDIATMRSALQRLEQDDLDSQSLQVLKRSAHKVAGTAAAIGCDSMSTIARHIETVVKLIEDESVTYVTGSIALVHAVQALELTLQSIASNGYESKIPLLELEEEYEALNIDIEAVHTVKALSSPKNTETTSGHGLSQHLDKLIAHTEKLIELDTPLEHAQQQVGTALNELEVAQARLRRLEPLLSSLSVTSNTTQNVFGEVGHPPSSLVARILQEAAERLGHMPQARSTTFTQPLLIQETALWDEMEIDRFSETNVLAHSLTEAIVDVAVATSHLRQALTHLKSIVARQASQVRAVRGEAFLLQSSPVSVLVTRLRQAIEMMTGTEKERVQFEASGDSIEISQDILETLTDPLLELVQMNVAESLFFTKKSEQGTEHPLRIWFNAHATGNEVTIEIGFSTLASPGTMTALQETAHHLYGSISLLERNGAGLTLQLRLPRSQRIIQGLLVRAGSQFVIVPISQIRRIQYQTQGMGKARPPAEHSQDISLVDTHEIVHLSTLSGFLPGNNVIEETSQAVLLLELDSPQIAVAVDEVVEEVALVMKPLAAHLCRPGITSTAFDGNGNALLVVNLPEMVRLKGIRQYAEEKSVEAANVSGHDIPSLKPTTPLRRTILIADDSVFIRQSIITTLSHEGFDVREAVDGLQTLEQLAQESPSLLLLDVEMPNLNGYDVLTIIRTHQEFADLKIVMLTSRSSEKHKRRASELGADAYLIKPCPQDLLLETIKSLIA